jgi:hypothetical protein
MKEVLKRETKQTFYAQYKFSANLAVTEVTKQNGENKLKSFLWAYISQIVK